MKRQSRNKARTESFDIVVNGQMIAVNATPYLINGEETRFRVSYNGSPVYIFGISPHTNHVVPVENKPAIPGPIVQAIANRLEQMENKRAA